MIETISCGLSFWPSFSKEVTYSRIRKGNRWLRKRCPWNSWCLLSFLKNTELCWSDISCFEVFGRSRHDEESIFHYLCGLLDKKKQLLVISLVFVICEWFFVATRSETPFSIVFNQWPTVIIKVFDDVCWKLLKVADFCWKLLKFADFCWKLLTFADFADFCWFCWLLLILLTFAESCWLLLTFAESCWFPLAFITMLDYFRLFLLIYADFCWFCWLLLILLTFADFADFCWFMLILLTFADLCWFMLIYDDLCWICWFWVIISDN